MKKIVSFIAALILSFSFASGESIRDNEDYFVEFAASYLALSESYHAPSIDMNAAWEEYGSFYLMDTDQYRIAIRADGKLISVISYQKCDGIDFLRVVCCAMFGFSNEVPTKEFMGNALDHYMRVTSGEQPTAFMYDPYICTISTEEGNYPDGIRFIAALSTEIVK